ncbi:hypothetical protein K8352_00980 [Flavobacteriaceae bacterium F89]|uniref:Uncharacterized protein n=1 Tax=Cerina litoralis TaxID=2874477 RepID=A0AAE3JM25_9FLAO|nr:hypothetical protein [Cerina litoralis]MCG2459315.1 hypothetical protein [Cerina litoralis]
MEANSSKALLAQLILLALSHCGSNTDKALPVADTDNGGLYLPTGLGALVGANSIGRTRHIAANGLMPPHRHLDDYSIAYILTYVRKRFSNGAPPINVKMVAEIRHSSNDKK